MEKIWIVLLTVLTVLFAVGPAAAGYGYGYHHGWGFSIGLGGWGWGPPYYGGYYGYRYYPPILLAPPVVVAPPPVVIVPQRVWVPGYLIDVWNDDCHCYRKAWVEGYWRYYGP